MPNLPKPEEILGNAIPPPEQVLGTVTPIDNAEAIKQKEKIENTSKIIDAIPDISQYQKDHIKDLTFKGANPEQLSSAIQQFQKQNEKDIHVWSDKPRASYGEYAYNKLAAGSAKLGSMLAKTPTMVYDLAAQAMNKTMELAVPFLNEEQLKQQGAHVPYSSEKENVLFSALPENKIAKYYDEDVRKRQEVAATRYDKPITDYIENGDYSKAIGAIGGSVLESAPVTISLMMGNAAGVGATGSTIGGGVVFAADKKSELDKDEAAKNLTNDQKLNIALSNGLFEGLFEQFGITKLGSLTKNVLLKEGKEEAKKVALDGFKSVYLEPLKKYVGTSLAEESLSEAATQFAQNAVDKYSGYKPGLNLKEGVVDAAIVGLASGGVMGAVPAKLESNLNKRTNEYAKIIQKEDLQRKENAKSEHAFHVSQQGEETIAAFESNVDNAVLNGNLTAEEGEKAKHRVRAYQQYEKDTEGLKIDDKNKRKIFDLSYQKQGLQTEVPEDVVENQLNPIELAKRNAKQHQIKALQKDIDALILDSQVKDEAVLGSKTESDVAKNKENGITGIPITDKEKKIAEREAKYKEETGYLPPPTREELKERAEKNLPLDTRKMEEVDPYEFNKEKSQGERGYNHRIKFAQVVNHLDSKPEGKEQGVLKLVQTKTKTKSGKFVPNTIVVVEMPSGHQIRTASSMLKEEGFRGHFREEHLPKGKKELSDKEVESQINDFPVGMKVVKTSPGIGGEHTAIKIYNAKTGKFLSWAKATTKGQDALEQPIITADDKFAGKKGITKAEKEGELKRREDLAREATVIEPVDNNLPPPPIETEPTKTPPVKPIVPTNVQTTNTENETGETATNSKAEISEESTTKSEAKPKTFRKGTKKARRKIKHPEKLKALSHEITSPYAHVLQYFIGGGMINPESIKKLYKNSAGELRSKISLVKKDAPKIPELSHELWETFKESFSDTEVTDKDFVNEIEDVLNSFTSATQMAKALNDAYTAKEERFNPEEEMLNEEFEAAEKEGINEEKFTEFADLLDKMDEEELSKLDNDAEEFTKWFNENDKDISSKIDEGEDIIRSDDEGDKFQKIKETLTEDEFYKKYKAIHQDYKSKTEQEAKDKFEKIKEEGFRRGFNVNAVPIWKGKEKDKGMSGAFGLEKGNYFYLLPKEAIKDGPNGYVTKEGWKPTEENFIKAESDGQSPYEAYLNSAKKESFQKQKATKGNFEQEHHENVLKVTKHIQKVLPKFKVTYNPHLKAAGKLSGNTIEINPYYANTDTPIHEAAHVLLDAMGHDNRVIQEAIRQIKATPKGQAMWEEVKRNYSELDERGQENELLAEAIGAEGAGIFDTEIQKGKFRQLIDYIFNWFKRNLGLDKSIVKSLAKQIISGKGLKYLEGKAAEEKLQKPKYEKVKGEPVKDLAEFRTEELNRDVEKESEDIEFANEIIKDKTSTEKEIKDAQGLKNTILNRQREDKKKYADYISQVKTAQDFLEDDGLENYSYEELLDIYNNSHYSMDNDSPLHKAVKLRIGIYLNEQQKALLEKNPLWEQKKENVDKKDLSGIQLFFKSLADVPEYLPGLQVLGKELNRATLAKATEIKEKGEKLTKLAKAVIKEKNGKLGLLHPKGIISSDSAKYFQYLDNGKGQLITAEEAEGLTKAQKDFRNYMQELIDERNTTYDENDNVIANDLMKIDKGFKEAWRTEGFLPAVANYLGKGINTDLLLDVNGEKVEFGDAQQQILSKTNTFGEKLKAGVKLAQLAYKAKINKEDAPYFNYKGALTSKFDRPRPEGKGYSKDFFSAGLALINDLAHVKNMSPIVPIFDSIHYLYERGFDTNLPNVRKFIESEMNDKLYQKQKGFEPTVDATLKFLRRLGSLTTMAFNIPANAVNIAIGNYSNWRQEGLPHIAKGNTRFFIGKRGGSVGEKAISKKALDVLKMFDVVKFDADSNPQVNGYKMFDKLAYFFNKIGEYQIQGSMFLGHLTDEEWKSFEYKDGKLKLKDNVDKKSFNDKMASYKDAVSSIQGKYDEKDRRMFMRGEFGKSLSQFKVYIPDWWRSRFGKEFINKYGITERGSWNYFTKAAIEELRNDISGNPLTWMNNKQTNRNLRGAIAIATLLMLTDDDKEKKKQFYETLSLENVTGNLLFIFKMDQLKYLIENPIAVKGTVTKFIDVLDGALHGDAKKVKKNLKKLTPYGKAIYPVLEGHPEKVLTGVK